MRFIEFTAGNINTTLFLDVTTYSLIVTYESTRRHVAEESISFVKILNHIRAATAYVYRYFVTTLDTYRSWSFIFFFL